MTQENQIPNRRAFDNWKVVGPTPRILSFILDGLLVAAIVLIGTLIAKKPITNTQTVYLWILTMWAWEGIWLTLTGTTPGRKPFGVSVYSPRAEGVPQPIQVCLRILTFWISLLLLGAGLTPIIFRKDRRGWHDLISETLTVGKEKQLPTTFAQTFGQTLLLIQSLVVFSTVGAILLTSGSHQSQKQISEQSLCDNKQLLINNPSEVLIALVISPAWHDCQLRLLSALGPLGDSQLGRLTTLSAKYFELWTLPESLRTKMYSTSIQPLEDEICDGSRSFDEVCKTARALSTITAQDDDESLSLGMMTKHEELLKTLSQETTPLERLSQLKKFYTQQSSPIIASALKDRIWAEELARGQRPAEVNPSSYNLTWNYQQQCWLEALELDTSSNCRDSDEQKAVAVVRSLKNADSVEDTFLEAQDQLSRLELDQTTSQQLKVLLEAWKSLRNNQPQVAANQLAEVPLVSPLKSVASQLAE